MHVTARIFLLRMVNKVVHIALQRAIAARRVGIEPTAPLHGEVGGLLHRLDRKVPRRLYHDTAVATHPGDNGRPILVVMAPPGLAFLTAPTRSTPQRLLATAWRLPLGADGVVEIIRFHR